ncbi:MAG: DEAD/DEAH box helicase [Anaerolineales bacterium]
MTLRLRFHGGTLVLEGAIEGANLPSPFQWVKGKPRCPAAHYAALLPWLRAHGVQDAVPRWHTLNLRLADPRQPHPYQLEALEAWLAAGARGSVVLPTGAGKTFLAIHAIARLVRSTLVVVPTIDLLHQWYSCLTAAFPETEVGVFYGLEKELRDLTVTTYHSASTHIGDFGDAFKLMVFDEAHHLPAPAWQEIALMSVAPHRLGLTATYPSLAPLFRIAEVPPTPLKGGFARDGSQLLDELIGPLVYVKTVDDLSGRELAEYRTVRVWVDLSPEERETYDTAYSEYIGFSRAAGLRESHGPGWWHEYTRRSAYDAEARHAKVAERRVRRLVANALNKLNALDDLLKQHAEERMLIFTEHNELVYQISRRHLIPAITHQTTARERKAILEGFNRGQYRAIVTSRVLNEGVDVPEAKVAVILGGSASAQEYIQRLGRILRKRENKTALLYEVVARGTIETGISQRRRRKLKYNVTSDG